MASSVVVAGTVVVVTLVVVTGALVAGVLVGLEDLVAVVSVASGEDGDNPASPRDLRAVAAHEPGGKPAVVAALSTPGFVWIMAASAVRPGAARVSLHAVRRWSAPR